MINENLRLAISAFLGACARYGLADKKDLEVRRLAVHTTFEVLCDAWERHAP